VEHNIPDSLASKPATLSNLASSSNTRPDRLSQIMRTLYNNGIFAYEPSSGTYSNNHVSTLLRTDHWAQWHAWVRLYGNEFYDMARGIPRSLGKTAVRTPSQIEYNTDDSMFKYFTEQGWIAKFHATLGAGAIAMAPGILEDYPWEEVAGKTVLDVGGGGGGLIALLLRRHKTMRGAVLDMPKVIEQAAMNFHGAEGQYRDVAEQVPRENLMVGDFMKQVPHFEVYTLKWCLHDWNDSKACTILRSIRQAIIRGDRSRLIILESVLSDGHSGRLSRYADMNMMVAVGGQERSETQWEELAAQTGWKLNRICTLRNAWPCVIEFIPVWASDHDVIAEMRFLEPWDKSKGNPYIRVEPAEGYDRMNFLWKDHAVQIENARSQKEDFELDKHGFMYANDATDSDMITALRENKQDMVKKFYYPHVESFVRDLTGAQRVIIFDHTLRKRRTELNKTENSDGKEQPATMVHCDQSEKGALRRLKLNIAAHEDVDTLLNGRVQMINVWRPLTEPVEDWPLATMVYSPASADFMFPCDLLRGEFEERGQTVTFVHDESQKWFYLDRQRCSELTVIKIWDSKAGVSQCEYMKAVVGCKQV
jgi:hypothetical protein